MYRTILKNIGLGFLSFWFGSWCLPLLFQYSQMVFTHKLCHLRSKAMFQAKYWRYTSKLKPYKNRIQPLSKAFKRLIPCAWKMPVLIFISLSVPITATCQSDMLTTQELSNYYSLIGLINTDLKDYDLVMQKSALQAQQIKGLQAINRKQQSISVRKDYTLEKYSSTIIQLQSQYSTLQSKFTTTTKQRNLARLENWLWRGSAAILIAKSLKLF